jgi:ribosomal protein L31
MAGEHCTSSCPTRDHLSFAECVRAKNLHPMWLGGEQSSATDQKRFDRTNQEFRQAVKDGLNPVGVSDRAIHAAYEQASGGS